MWIPEDNTASPRRFTDADHFRAAALRFAGVGWASITFLTGIGENQTRNLLAGTKVKRELNRLGPKGFIEEYTTPELIEAGLERARKYGKKEPVDQQEKNAVMRLFAAPDEDFERAKRQWEAVALRLAGCGWNSIQKRTGVYRKDLMKHIESPQVQKELKTYGKDGLITRYTTEKAVSDILEAQRKFGPKSVD